MTEVATRKKTAKSISLYKAEGLHETTGVRVTLTGENVWAQAAYVLKLMGAECEPNMLGVLKTDFTITWSNGDAYEGTFGLTRTNNDLIDHVKGHLTYMLKQLSEPKMKYLEKSWGVTQDELLQYLATHQFGDK